MYYPYFRGKQYELLLLKEQAGLFNEKSITPIIEPVKKNMASLQRSITELVKNETNFILIVNPSLGDFSKGANPDVVSDLVDKLLRIDIGSILNNDKSITLGYLLEPKSNLSDFKDFLEKYKKYNIALVHNGFPKAKQIKELIEGSNIVTNIFLEDTCSKLYRKKFEDGERVLIRDGFKKKSNRGYDYMEHFSDLHVTYDEEKMTGFGDFLIAGSDYSESGGPAYAVAIHMTYIDDEEDNDMFVKHYVSDRNSTPDDPGGKFLEALRKLHNDVDEQQIEVTSAVKEYMKLYDQEHYPGLGYAKKLSMLHHIEVIANFIGDK